MRLNTAVDKAYAEKENADVIIVAAGSAPLLPPIKGLGSDHVLVPNDYHHHVDKITDEMIVLAGGLAGCEVAIHFARENKKVKLIEMNSELSPEANVRHRPLLLVEIEKCAIEVFKNHKAIEVTQEGVTCQTAEGEAVFVPGTSVVCALRQTARHDIVDELWDAAPLVSQVGDCVKVSTITTAVYQGHHAAKDV